MHKTILHFNSRCIDGEQVRQKKFILIAREKHLHEINSQVSLTGTHIHVY